MDSEQEYAKQTFDEVAQRYESITFFKTSAKYLAEHIKQQKVEAKFILDVACGTGNVTVELAQRFKGAKVEGVDISEGMLSIARKKLEGMQKQNVSFFHADIVSHQFEKKYDIIVCSYVLFFLPNPHEILQKLVQCLTDDGKLFFTSFTSKAFEPSKQILMDLLASYGVEIPTGNHLESKEEILDLCSKAGVSKVDIVTQPMKCTFSVAQWWKLNNDAGWRGLLMQLNSEAYESLKEKYFEKMQTIAREDNIPLVTDSYFCSVAK